MTRPATSRRRPTRCTRRIGAVRDAVARALAEDLDAARRPHLGAAAARRRAPRRRSWPAPTACSPGACASTEAFAPGRPRRHRRVACRRRRPRRRRVGRSPRVAGPLASILTAERTALNFLGHLSGIATAHPPLRRGRGRGRTPAGLGHPQDHARPARAREGGRAGRRRRNHRGQPLRLGPVEGQPPRRLGIAEAVAPAHAPLARAHRRTSSATRLEQVDEALDAGRRRSAARQHDARRGPRACEAAAHAGGRRRRACVEVSGGITLDTVARLRRHAAPTSSSSARITNSAPVLDIGLDIVD